MLYGNPQDFGFLPPQFKGDVQIFTTPNVLPTQWQQWTKPKGAGMVYMICIGGGAGGGAGQSGATNTPRGGGGGGACSSISTALIPAIVLPDTLKISVGLGGIGGSGSGQNGLSGSNSYIAMGEGRTSGSAIPNIILSANSTPNARGGGSGSIAGAGAAGGTPNASAKNILGWAGVYSINGFTSGLAGALGGSHSGSSGANVASSWNITPLSPGAGGAGVSGSGTGFAGGSSSIVNALDFAGGGVFYPNNIISGGFAGGAGNAGDGNSGLSYWKPFLQTGGTGGGSSDSGNGGNGGKGGIGCGGGGGGGGIVGGAGGDGGPGLVAIISW